MSVDPSHRLRLIPQLAPRSIRRPLGRELDPSRHRADLPPKFSAAGACLLAYGGEERRNGCGYSAGKGVQEETGCLGMDVTT
jgi:hypothetical protein